MKNQKEKGIHYTPTLLANFVASQILNAWLEIHEPTKNQIQIFDPAVGDGELLLAVLQKLSGQGDENATAFGLDTDLDALQIAKARIKKSFPDIPVTLACGDFIDFVLKNYSPPKQPHLFPTPSSELFDLVIANPPYVRTQVIGAKKSQQLASQFGLSGRVDLYYAFIIGIAEILKPDGVAGIIVSNRFLTTKSGASVRNALVEKFEILHIWDLGDTKLFEAAVLPSVLLVKRKYGSSSSEKVGFTSIYSVEQDTANIYVDNPIEALREDGIVETNGGSFYHVQQGILDYGENPRQVWRLSTETSKRWLATVESRTHSTFGEIGKIRVGVKTTADKVFIRSDWCDMPEDERPELLRPLITHHIARRYKAIQNTKYREILYTHEVVNGKRVSVTLDNYPQSAKYLNRHRKVLERRRYLHDAGRNWYEIWVPQDPDVWVKPKIVFRDIAEKPTFWLDMSGAVVNGDCYWFTCTKLEQIDLLWLALAVGNSSFIETFYDYRFNNKLYAGRRRFITQYVEKFPLPDPRSAIAKQIIQLSQELYNLADISPHQNQLEKLLNELVWKAFGLPIKENSLAGNCKPIPFSPSFNIFSDTGVGIHKLSLQTMSGEI